MDIFVYSFIFIMILTSAAIVLRIARAASPRRKALGVVSNTVHWALCAWAYSLFPTVTVAALIGWAVAVIAMLYSGFDLGASIRAQYGIEVEEVEVAFEDLPAEIAAELERIKREG